MTTSKQVAFRLDVDLIKRIDKYMDYLSSINHGLNLSRTDAARVLILRALESAEQEMRAYEAKEKGKAKR